MLHLSASTRYYLCASSTDMRRGFDALSGMVSAHMQAQPLCTSSVFIFFSKNRRHIKLLHWEGDGYALYHKRLEKGTYELPEVADKDATSLTLSHTLLIHILQGLSLAHIKNRVRYQHPPVDK